MATLNNKAESDYHFRSQMSPGGQSVDHDIHCLSSSYSRISVVTSVTTAKAAVCDKSEVKVIDNFFHMSLRGFVFIHAIVNSGRCYRGCGMLWGFHTHSHETELCGFRK